MKSLLIFIGLVFVLFIIVNNLPPNIGGVQQKFIRQTATSFRYAALYAREPEAKISIPICTVKTKQITDSFGARRD